MQSTPEVSVSGDGQISVKGNSQVTVLVDGKPTAMMSGAEQMVALQTMSGADIASIEVITNPSAAYNANGGRLVEGLHGTAVNPVGPARRHQAHVRAGHVGRS